VVEKPQRRVLRTDVCRPTSHVVIRTGVLEKPVYEPRVLGFRRRTVADASLELGPTLKAVLDRERVLNVAQRGNVGRVSAMRDRVERARPPTFARSAFNQRFASLFKLSRVVWGVTCLDMDTFLP
jgi:hypothetical protein